MDMQVFFSFVLASLALLMMALHQVWQFERSLPTRPSLARFWLLATVNLVRVLLWRDPLSFAQAYPSLVRSS